MRIYIFANGLLSSPTLEQTCLQPGDIVIAADGGARHCKTLGIQPNIVIGDFDSLNSDELTHLGASGAQLIRYPARKDFTDLELALRQQFI